MENKHEEETNIVIRLPRWRKGQYVGASRHEGKTLVGWILEKCDAGVIESGWSIQEKDRPNETKDAPGRGTTP